MNTFTPHKGEFMNAKYINMLILLSVFIGIVACAEKPSGMQLVENSSDLESNLNSEFASTSVQNHTISSSENQTVMSNIPTPANIICNLTHINDEITQAEVIWDNDLNRYNDQEIVGYQYVWNVYGDKIPGFINRENNSETFTGTSLVFNQENPEEPITLLSRGDYGNMVSEYSEVVCR